MPDESVRVAVRVRPFNSREKDRGAKLVIDMQGKMTIIKDPEQPNVPPKEFSFDFSYWSHDGMSENENGLLIAENPRYADQRSVFNDLGQGVLDNAVAGFNCSLFAYGQTGSGKSYSMVGYGANKGIVPITCDELFKIIERGDGSIKYQVTFSMLEIYNEQVRDLLTKDNPKGGLQVRQNPKIGAFYVQGLKFVAVGSYKEIEKRTEEGTANRTVASTQMNATSSRAHTVVTIQFDQISKNDMGQETKKTSIINLVDLAAGSPQGETNRNFGSERAESTGATGDRLKEGANINKSLSSLGNVISALADLSMGKKKVLVPYRDSVLTKLLQNALGGNSKTIMIAALSPADINYDETLGTLRYADRAKKIKNKAVVNENPMDKLIRELKEENDRLKKAMSGGGLPAAGEATGGIAMTEDEKERMRKEMEEEIRAQLEANAMAMMSWDEKLQVSRSEESTEDSDSAKFQTTPHMINLNEDNMLSGVIKHCLKEGETTIGRKDAQPDIPMTGLSITKQHAVLIWKETEITLKPGSSGSKTKVNGVPLTGERVLKHLDRILYGSNHMYYFVNPLNKEKSEGTPDKVDWDFAQKEIAHAKGFQTGFGAGLSKEQQMAQEQVLEMLPLVSEVNAISEELDKQKTFEIVLISSAAQEAGGKETKVIVKMKNLLNDNVWMWERGKFMNRRFLMMDMYQRYLDGDETVKDIPQDEDPFWEPPEDVLIGTANVFLQSLSYALDFDDKLMVTDYKGSEEGHIIINVTPCTANGKALDEDSFIDDPKDLLGKPYHFKVNIRNAEVQKARFSQGLYIKYTTMGETEPAETPVVKDTLAPEFNHSKIFSFPSITDDHLEWFDSGCITFFVFGKQIDTVSDGRLLKMSTKELRQMEQFQKPVHRQSTFQPGVGESAQLKSELILHKRKLKRLQEKEKRIQDIVTEWEKKPQEQQDFTAFHKAIHAAAFYQRGQLKYKVNMLQSFLKNQKDATANGGDIKTELKPSGNSSGSKACSVM